LPASARGALLLATEQQTVGEAVLAGRSAGSGAECLQHLSGDHAVLVLAEDVLKFLEPFGFPPGRLADNRPDQFGRVAGPLGRLAGLVQGDIARRALAGPKAAIE